MNSCGKHHVGCVALVCGLLGVPLSGYAESHPSDHACTSRTNDSVAKLVECIRRDALWDHMIAFQRIADENPGPDGHPSRNVGEPGYKASVDYVARLMKEAGYRVAIQRYTVPYFSVKGTPKFSELSPKTNEYRVGQDWYVAYNSGEGNLTRPVQPVGGIIIPATGGSQSGCSSGDFVGFVAGRIALIQRGGCPFDTKVANAVSAGAAGVIIFNEGDSVIHVATPRGSLSEVASVPVILVSYSVGADLYQQYVSPTAPVVHLHIRTIVDPAREDYNLIADSRFGDPNHVVVVDAHLDAIFGAGILDNASGSSTILEVALKMAKTPTRNQLRFIWFGGEEIGLFGSHHYTRTLTPAELSRIVFNIDADDTATPNYDIIIVDPAGASNVASFPPNVVPASQLGNRYFSEWGATAGVPVYSCPAFCPLGPVGNDGTDSNSFSLVGVPNAGIATLQNCCKSQTEVGVWGGVIGNYEGHVPGFDGGCVDYPGRWCDNLSNADSRLLELISKGVAYVTFKLANDQFLNPRDESAAARDLERVGQSQAKSRRSRAQVYMSE